MQNIDTFFDNLKELVMISDLDSLELIRVNKYTRNYLKLKAASKLSSIKCYEIFHDDPFSNPGYSTEELRENFFYEWSYFDPITRRSYLRKASIIDYHGQKVRFEIAIDTTIENDELDLVNELNANDHFINSAMIEALNLDDSELSIQSILASIGKKTLCDRISLIEGDSSTRLQVTYEWCDINQESLKLKRQHLKHQALQDWLNAFAQNQDLIYDNLRDFKRKEDKLVKALSLEEDETVVALPLKFSSNKYNFILIENIPAYKLDSILELLSLLRHFVYLLLRQRDNIKILAKISYHDELTGLGNRHALAKSIQDMADTKLGLIMLDLNGLKETNDKFGHAAGDLLIVSITKLLKGLYSANNLFRLGGDEFLVIQANKAEEEFLKALDELKLKLEESNIKCAIGSSWSENGRVDFEKLLATADRNMYQNKKAFYKNKNKN